MAQSTKTLEEEGASVVSIVSGIPPWRYCSSYLLNGVSNDMAVDGSGGAPLSFSFSPGAVYDLFLSRVMIFMQTGGAMSVETFGDIVALGHGVEFKSDGVLLTTWKDNIDIYTECFDVDTLANVTGSAADTTLNTRWSLTRDFGGPGLLVKDIFEAVVNDDISGLTRYRIKIKGKLVAA